MFTHLAIAKLRSLLFGVLFLLVSCNVSNDVELDPLGLRGSYTRQFGTAYGDEPMSITTHINGRVYIAVNTKRETGVADAAYLYEYDASGTFLKTITPPGCCGYWYSYLRGVTTDAEGHVYMTGDYSDYRTSYAYIAKYTADFSSGWVKQFREPDIYGDPTRVRTNAVATDARGNVYLMFERKPYPYQNRSIYVRKYNPSGKLLWERGIGSSSSYTAPATMTTDVSGNVYASWASVNNFDQTDVSLAKYDSKGNFLWSRLINPPATNQRTYGHGLATDANGNVYIVGITNGSLEGTNQGAYNAYLRKYDPNGNALWTRQFGTNVSDYANAVTADAFGNIYVAGSTQGSLQANVTNKGDYDAYVCKYDTNGNVLQTRQFGTSTFDKGSVITTDGTGNVYVAGATLGSLRGTNKGGLDTYLRKYTP